MKVPRLLGLLGAGKFHFHGGYMGRKGNLRQTVSQIQEIRWTLFDKWLLYKPSEMYTWPQTSLECALYSVLRTEEAARIQRMKSIWFLAKC